MYIALALMAMASMAVVVWNRWLQWQLDERDAQHIDMANKVIRLEAINKQLLEENDALTLSNEVIKRSDTAMTARLEEYAKQLRKWADDHERWLANGGA